MQSRTVETPEDFEASAFRRFAELVKRDLHADDVRLLDARVETVEASNVLYAKLPDGRSLAAIFSAAPPDASALAMRLQILAGTFAQALGEGAEERRARLSVPRSLHEELRALAARAAAVDAVVLDAHSPVIWGSALVGDTQAAPEDTPELNAALRRVELSRFELIAPALLGLLAPAQDGPVGEEQGDARADAGADAGSDAGEAGSDAGEAGSDAGEAGSDAGEAGAAPPAELALAEAPMKGGGDPPSSTLAKHTTTIERTARAVREVRALPQIDALRRGRHLHQATRDAEFGYVAHSFAAIYLVVLVFDAPFDELRAERALVDAVRRIEGLVLALPPLDPTPEPGANVVSLRSRARR